MRLLWLVVGFLGGIAYGRNAGSISVPFLGVLVLGAVALGLLGWWAGNRDRATAVATAVAVANAEATAKLDAVLSAQATATGGSVQLVIGGMPYGLSPDGALVAVEAPGEYAIETVGRHAAIENTHTHTDEEMSHDHVPGRPQLGRAGIPRPGRVGAPRVPTP